MDSKTHGIHVGMRAAFQALATAAAAACVLTTASCGGDAPDPGKAQAGPEPSASAEPAAPSAATPAADVAPTAEMGSHPRFTPPPTDPARTGQAPRPGNVLLIILDDVGIDAVSCYPAAEPDARTPVLDALAARGMRFDRTWSNPSCSPTRATILSGRYGFRTGIGSVHMRADGVIGLSPDEVTLPEALSSISPQHRSAFLGKWHLGMGKDAAMGPRAQGFEHFRGTNGNLGGKLDPERYFAYQEIIEEGDRVLREAYSTTAIVDDTLAAIERFGDEPWLVVTSFHAAHTPLHVPPADLHTRELKGPPSESPRPHFLAIVDAVDKEIGRLVAGLGDPDLERTHVIVVGDNGGASSLRSADQVGRAGKGSLFEDGIRVPMIVAGPAVRTQGQSTAVLVNTTDLFRTSLELCTGTPESAPADSVSFVPLLGGAPSPGTTRTWAFAERFRPGTKNKPPVDLAAITTGRFKRIADAVTGRVRLYDLDADPLERTNLLQSPPLTEEAASALTEIESVATSTLPRPAPQTR